MSDSVNVDVLFSEQVIGSKIVAAKANLRLSEYEPDPTTGKQKPGTLLEFGLKGIDDLVVMLRSCLYMVAARPRTGKSAFMMQVVDSALRQLKGTGRVVVIWSAEMDAATLALRESCAVEGLSYWKLVKGKLSPEEYGRIRRRNDMMGEHGFLLDESSSPTLEHMAGELKNIVDGGRGIGLICLDYMQLAGEMDRDEVKRVEKIGRGLKGLAKRYDCPVLVLSQLNRDIEKRAEGQARLSDLMFGGEASPDGIIILSRPWLLDNLKPKEQVDVYVVKNRHGPGGYCVLSFDDQAMRFRDAKLTRVPLNDDPPPKPAPVPPKLPPHRAYDAKQFDLEEK